ncbi:hypothetical protein BJ138DRAFT_1101042 [Hygrophoropsis aurantiaca]|uniref:Uncharacterized protein n=1 Tax=Hygrophoropsis aurantiaca TaxID=72124 RepID=A0ACB8AFJ0_9AGAM|nr:hypothetical protein BJ138DRAFT_1101042 [Hygrophoropsis aurantiaca]
MKFTITSIATFILLLAAVQALPAGKRALAEPGEIYEMAGEKRSLGEGEVYEMAAAKRALGEGEVYYMADEKRLPTSFASVHSGREKFITWEMRNVCPRPSPRYHNADGSVIGALGEGEVYYMADEKRSSLSFHSTNRELSRWLETARETSVKI